MSVRFFSKLSLAAALAVSASAAHAQWDPESGDTGEGWEAPPEQTEPQQPPPQQPPPQQPPPQQQQPQQPPPQNNGWQQPPQQPNPPQQPPQQQGGGAWHQGDGERPPAMGGGPQGGETPEEPAGDSDHDNVGFGLSFFGINTVNISPEVSPVGNQEIPLATIGLRYWFGGVGLDFGVGIGTSTRREINSCTDPGDSCSNSERIGGINGGFGLGIHLGLPIAVSTGAHYALLIIPEFDFAYGAATVFVSPLDPDLDIALSGIQLDIGVRAGGEFHFGGIGLPNLALQLTVGLGFRYASSGAANNVPVPDTSGRVVDFQSNEISIRTIANDLLNGLVRINYYF